MPRPSPAIANHVDGFLLDLLLVGCGPNTVLVPAMQYGMNVGDLALSNLFDATDDDQPIDPEAIRAKGRAVCVEEQLTEADCARVMAQVEKNIDLVYRLQGLDAMAEASRRQRLQQALTRSTPSPASPRGLRVRPARSARPVLRPGCEAAVFSTVLMPVLQGRQRRLPCVPPPMTSSSCASRSPKTDAAADRDNSRIIIVILIPVSFLFLGY